jgi:hypothetical protein
LGKSNRQDFSADNSKDGQTAKLKRRIHHLEKENKQLKSELRSYEKALSKNITFIKEKSRGLSLEDLIAGANADLNLQQITDEKIDLFKDLKKKWECNVCNTGIMKFIVIPRGNDNYYFRKCSVPNCKNRTEAKILTDNVDRGV